MAKSRRLMPSVPGRSPFEELEVQQFSRKLAQLMRAKGWSQSDLARAVWGENDKGYGRNRDRISVYLQGRGYPDPKNLGLIAEALEVSAEELAPDLTAATIDKERPELAMTQVAGHPDKVLLRVNKLVPATVAAEVIAILVKHQSPVPA
jgi:transcriptional regulator with XRE-family HTH domain